MCLPGFVLVGDGLGAALASDEAGVTAKAELKSLARFAAKVAHGGGSAEFVNI